MRILSVCLLWRNLCGIIKLLFSFGIFKTFCSIVFCDRLAARKSERQLEWRPYHAKNLLVLLSTLLISIYLHFALKQNSRVWLLEILLLPSNVLLFSLVWAGYSPHRLNDSPIIAYNVPVYKYTSVYLNGKMYTEKKIEMFVCHCNLGVGTFRVWFLATIWDHKQRANLNNVWLSGQVQSNKYQAFMRVFLQAKPGEFCSSDKNLKIYNPFLGSFS